MKQAPGSGSNCSKMATSKERAAATSCLATVSSNTKKHSQQRLQRQEKPLKTLKKQSCNLILTPHASSSASFPIHQRKMSCKNGWTMFSQSETLRMQNAKSALRKSTKPKKALAKHNRPLTSCRAESQKRIFRSGWTM